MEKWRILDSKKLVENKWITVEKHKCDIGGGNVIDDYYIIKKKDYVILVVEEDGNLVFLEQYRHGIGQVVLNFPMGLIDDGENPEATAKRELLEETGYEAEELKYIGEFFLAPSNMTSKAHVFFTNKVKKKKNDMKDPEEGELRLVKMSKSEVKRLIKQNGIKDMSTLTALLIAKEKLELF